MIRGAVAVGFAIVDDTGVGTGLQNTASLVLEHPAMYNKHVLVKKGSGGTLSASMIARTGAAVIAVGVVLDIPPHLLSGAPLELLALVGHIVVLAGMAIVLFSLVIAARTAPHLDHRR